MIYPLVIFLHSWLRWGVLFLGVITLWQALMGWARGQNVSPEERRTQMLFISALDTQVLLGLALYFVLSPGTPKSLSALRLAMPYTVPRFYAVEHLFGMLVALVLVHFSSVRSRRALGARARHAWWALGLLVALGVIVLSIPWPSLPYGRPLFRMGLP